MFRSRISPLSESLQVPCFCTIAITHSSSRHDVHMFERRSARSREGACTRSPQKSLLKLKRHFGWNVQRFRISPSIPEPFFRFSHSRATPISTKLAGTYKISIPTSAVPYTVPVLRNAVGAKRGFFLPSAQFIPLCLQASILSCSCQLALKSCLGSY